REEADLPKLKAEANPPPAPKAEPINVVAALVVSATPSGYPRLGVALEAELITAEARLGLLGPRTQAQVREERARLVARSKDLKAHPIDIAKAYAVQDSDKIANAKIQRKGDPRNPGDEVPRGFLAVLGGQKLPLDEK